MYLFGASGHARVIVDILKTNNMEVLGFFDDYAYSRSHDGIPLLGTIEEHSSKYNPCIIAIGDNRIRKNVTERLSKALYKAAFHRTAVIAYPKDIGEGTVIMAGSIVNPSTKVGRHCIINTSASVDHDCLLSDLVHVAPNATLCGGVKVGEGALIGSGATIIPNVSLGKWTIIGAGAVIIEDVPDYAVVVGNPGRIVKVELP